MWREANMKSNSFWAAVSKVLVVVTITLIAAAILAPSAWAAGSYKVLHRFHGPDGANSREDTLTFDANGNLYGTTEYGGDYGQGTVFQLVHNPDGNWSDTVLHSFTAGSDGGRPNGDVIFDAIGNLYGTTCCGGDYDGGTVFELTPNLDGTWSESVLHSFSGGGDGAGLYGGLVFDASGILYGTASSGGAYGYGVVFKLAPNQDGTWTESTIHDFKGNKDGGTPNHGALIFDGDGNLYGTTFGFFTGTGHGTVFQLIPNTDGTWTENVLHSFRGGKDGSLTQGTPVFDQTGSLYAVTAKGGAYGQGTVFKLTPGSDGKWTKEVLHQFRGGKDGSTPWAGVVFDADGNLYGTTHHGGGGSCDDSWGHGCGTVFKLIPNSKGAWTEQVLRRFKGAPNGNPLGTVLLDAAGNLYATTSNIGTDFLGVVFEITP
jgi:uncharacterized repeat protein (TIGR03803 family)